MVSKITLYTTHCPRCRMLESLLENSKLDYEIKDDESSINLIIDKGFKTAPVMEVNGEFLTFKDAMKWLKEN